ncbi:MAG: SCO family protein [bacterium]
MVSAQGLTSNTGPDVLEQVGIDQKLDEQVPLHLMFRDESGQEVELAEYFGQRPVVLSLVYYECPMLCTMILNGLLKCINVLEFDVGEEFEIVTVSFDPKETPDMAAKKKESYLAQYGRKGAEAGWHFLTGDEASIKQLTDAVGFRYVYDAARDEYVHASGIMVLTPGGKLSRYAYGIEYSPRDLKLAVMEASDNKIGSLADQVLLFCYHYDPTTGKYGVAIMNIIRVVGLLTILALGTFVTVSLRRDRQGKKHVETI